MLKQLKEDVQAVFARDPAARNTFEVLTTYPGIHALIMHRLHMNSGIKIVKLQRGCCLLLVVLPRALKFIRVLKLVNAFSSTMVWAL